VSHPASPITTLPKVELHVHLEGTITAARAATLAEAHGVDPRTELALVSDAYPDRFRDFDHFLEVFLRTVRQVRTPDDLAAVAADFVREQSSQAVLWTEATFTPATLVANGVEPGPMWQALRDGFAAAPDVRVGLIVDTLRDDGPAGVERLIGLVEEADAPIVALGLTGREHAADERGLTRLRSAADALELGLVVHAGETGGPDRVRAAIEVLGADRIAHGIAACQDAELVSSLARGRVALDVCPSSNVALGLVADLDHHPFARLWSAGVPVTVGSDDPPFFGTRLTDELEHVTRLAGLTRREVAALQRTAIRASFAPASIRDIALARIDAWDAAPSV
jgi:aminodeoxyfutalosine deaminase